MGLTWALPSCFPLANYTHGRILTEPELTRVGAETEDALAPKLWTATLRARGAVTPVL